MRASIAFILRREIFPTSIALPTAAAGSRPQPHRRLRWWRRGCDWTATKKSSFGAAINDAVRLVSSPAAVLVHVDARFYLRGRKGGRRERGRGRETEGVREIVDVLSVSVSFVGNHCEITITHDFHLHIRGGTAATLFDFSCWGTRNPLIPSVPYSICCLCRYVRHSPCYIWELW